MRIEEVHFNHDPAAATSDALTIRTSVTGLPIRAPEWRRGLPPQPIAYASARLGPTVKIRARFSGGPRNGARHIRAIDAYVPPAEPAGCLGWLFILIAQILHALFGNILGKVGARTVSYDAAGHSGLATFTLVGHKLKSASVGIGTTAWKWQYRLRWRWVTFDTTHHKIYVVLDMPTGPWTQGMGNDPQLSWTDALDKARLWALGAKTKDQAAAVITRAVNTQPLQSYTGSVPPRGVNPGD
jgi:hypothetical protein